jgi:hypothetical protein
MIEGLILTQWGQEVTMGTEVNATTVVRGVCTFNNENERTFPPEDIGISGGVGRSYVAKKNGSVTIDDMTATFEQLPYLGDCGIDTATPAQDASGGYEYEYVVPYNQTTYAALSGITHLTQEFGDEQQAKVFTVAFAETITISGERGQAWKLDGTTFRVQPRENTTFTGSVAIPTVEEILFGNTSLYINDNSSAFGTTQIDNFLSFSLEITQLYKAEWIGDGSGVYFGLVKAIAGPQDNITLTWTGEHDADAVTEDGKRENGTTRAVRIESLGSAIADGSTYTNKTARLDLCGTYTQAMELGREDGNVTATHTLRCHYDSTLTTRLKMIVVNELSTLP